MGKNLTATICENNDCEELCYYGATICNKCEDWPILKCGCKKGDYFTSITGETVCSCKLNNTAKKIDDGYPLGTPCLCSEYSGDEVECPIHGGEEE